MKKTPLLAVLLGVAAILLAMSPSMATAAPEIVVFETLAVPGTVVIETNERRLYLVMPNGRALRYVVGVGRQGKQWSGTSSISAKYLSPNWAPPAEIRRDEPSLPAVIAGGAATNPMGAAAMTLTDTAYAIHGTNAPRSSGGFVSYGCIRMLNEDISDLHNRVRVGTTVIVEH